MSVVLHVSDLHFGRVDPLVEECFLNCISKLNLDVSVVSGDFTQRAKVGEFKEAAEFVKKLPSPHLLIPGNHDIPLYNIFGRFISRLARYRRLITNDLFPIVETQSALIVGINTARSLTIKDGRVSESQIAHLKRIFSPPSSKIKVLVTHHPLHMLKADDDRRVASQSRLAVDVVRECGVDVLLSGHYHQGGSGISTVHKESRYDVILVQAGTSLSTRYRGQDNAFNVLKLETDKVSVTQYEWQLDARIFSAQATTEYQRTEGRWHLAHVSS